MGSLYFWTQVCLLDILLEKTSKYNLSGFGPFLRLQGGVLLRICLASLS